jgi:glucose/mannose-6-phosphate isomerase
MRVFGKARVTELYALMPICSAMSGPLDDPARIRALDKSLMLEQIMGLPDQVKEALSWKVSLDLRPDSMCICGMGGSAVGGDVLSDYAVQSSDKQLTVIRGGELPRWVGPHSLVLMVSYSGNTWEVLDLYKKAKERGLPIVAVTSGGELMSWCQRDQNTYVKVPSGIQPRAALGYLLGASALIAEAVGVAPAVHDLRRANLAMSDLRENLSSGVPTDVNMAKRLALKLHAKVPVIYAPRTIRTVAYRWQTQINENAKMLAFSGEFPEMNHNQLVSWMEDARCKDFVPVFLKTIASTCGLGEKMCVSVQLIKESGNAPVEVELSGRTPMETSLMGIMLGDFVSFYLAVLKGVDPSPVMPIHELKRRMP